MITSTLLFVWKPYTGQIVSESTSSNTSAEKCTNSVKVHTFVCLYVCLSHSIIVHSYVDFTLSVKGFKFWPMLNTHGHPHEGLFSVPYLLWHGPSVYNGHLRGPVTLAPIAEFWQWSCHYLLLRRRSFAAGKCTRVRKFQSAKLVPLNIASKSRDVRQWRIISSNC